MIDILMQLADIGSTVTIVITKKEENYLISVTPKVPNQQLQPVLISGTKEDVLADFPNLLKGMGEMKKHISNLASINEKLEKKVVEKTAPTATATAEKAKTSGKKGPIKVGSGTTAAPAATELFAAASTPAEDDNQEANEELDEEEAIIDDVAEEEAEIAQSEPEVVEPPKPEPKKEEPIVSPTVEEEEIF